MTSKQEYLAALRTMTTKNIKVSLASPTAFMRPIHIKLHKIELRNRGELTN